RRFWRYQLLFADSEQNVTRSNARGRRRPARVDVLEYPPIAVRRLGFREGRRNRNPACGTWGTLMEEPGVAGAQVLQHLIHRLLEFFGGAALYDALFVLLGQCLGVG